MKKVLLLTAIILTVCMNSQAQFTLQDSLIAHYPMSGNAQDISGNANHGTPVGAVLSTDRFGTAGEAYLFDGIDDYLSLASSQKFKPSLPVTITAWILVEKNGSNMAFQNDWQENFYNGVFLNIFNYRITASYGDGGPSGQGSRRTKQGVTTLVPNTWYHVAAVIRGPLDMDLYLNGKNDCGTYSGSGGGITYTASNGRMGNSDGLASPGPLVFYQGKIDDVRFYNRALSQQEIASMQDNVAPLIATDSICSGQSLPISVPGGYSSYTWQPTFGLSCSTCQSSVVTPSQSTTYKVLMTKAPGCVDTFTYHIVDTCCQKLTVLPQVIQPVSCFGQSDAVLQINVSHAIPPVYYSINNGPPQTSNIFPALGPGTYQVIVTDSAGCTNQGVAIIQNPPAISLTITSGDVSCFGGNDGSAVATANGGAGGFTFSWSNGVNGSTISNLVAQIYSVTVSDAQGCTDSQAVVINQPDSLEISINVTHISCNGRSDGNLSANVQGGTSPYTFLWGNGQNSDTLSGVGAGNYSLLITDQQGCTEAASATVEMPPPISLTISVIQDVTCFGLPNGMASALATGGTGAFSYSWSNGTVLSLNENLPAGMALVTVTDGNGCSTTDSVIISQPDSLTIMFDAVEAVSCFGGSDGAASVMATGGVAPYSFLWANSQMGSQLLDASAGLVGVTVTDSLGCKKDAVIFIFEPDPIDINLVRIEPAVCNRPEGEMEVQVTGGTSPVSYQWNNGSTDSVLTGLTDGRYELRVTDVNGCEGDTAFSIQSSYPVEAIATIYQGSGQYLTEDIPIQFQDSSVGVNARQWNFGNGNQSTRPDPVHVYSVPGTYMVLLTVWDADSTCPDTDTLFLEIGEKSQVFVPSAFSPNGDGVNDQFSIISNSVVSLEVEIYSRWGVLVAILNSPEITWDGRLIGGGDAPEGVYVFRLTALLDSGEEIRENGTITLIR